MGTPCVGRCTLPFSPCTQTTVAGKAVSTHHHASGAEAAGGSGQRCAEDGTCPSGAARSPHTDPFSLARQLMLQRKQNQLKSPLFQQAEWEREQGGVWLITPLLQRVTGFLPPNPISIVRQPPRSSPLPGSALLRGIWTETLKTAVFWS